MFTKLPLKSVDMKLISAGELIFKHLVGTQPSLYKAKWYI